MRVKPKITKTRPADDVLKIAAFFKKWPGRSLTSTDLLAVEMFAVWKGKIWQAEFAIAYSKQPDLVAALLVYLTAANNPKTVTDWLNMNFDKWIIHGVGVHRDSELELEIVPGEKLKPMRLRSINDVTDEQLAAIFTKAAGRVIPTHAVKKFRQSRAKGTK